MKKYFLSFIALLRFPKSLFFLFGVYFRYFIGIRTKPLEVQWRDFDPGKSFIRWGDGETMVALGIPMVFYFQYEHSSPRLAEKMQEILAYEGDNLVIGLPREFLIHEEQDTEYIRAWIITRNLFQSDFIAKDKLYGDAFFFRQIGSYERFLDLYQGKKVFLITNSDSIEKISRDGRLPLIGSYAIPKTHAFDTYDTSKAGVLEALEAIDPEIRKHMSIVVSGGPMAKVLAFELTRDYGYICHDTGQFFDLFLK